jgi:hypothetical protein
MASARACEGEPRQYPATPCSPQYQWGDLLISIVKKRDLGAQVLIAMGKAEEEQVR